MVNRFLDTACLLRRRESRRRARSDLDFNGLKSDYGFGVRFHGPLATPLRIEVARSPEGLAFIFASARDILRMLPCHIHLRAHVHVPPASPILLVAALGMFASAVSTKGPHFYPDDPIAREPESQDASKAQPYKIGVIYEMTNNLFVTSGYKPSGTAREEHQHD